MAGTAKAKVIKADILSAKEIKKYIRVAMIAAKREKERVKLRERLIPRLEAGARAAEDSPFELQIRHVDKSAVNWREVAVGMLREQYPEDWEKRVVKLEVDNRRGEKHLVHVPNMAFLNAV